jgi:(p)ppGpp synthase/HD superfamily hydrolase
MTHFHAGRLGTALAIATRAHTGQCRKGTQQPYISHPLAVAALAIEYGTDEEQVLAALLHDAIEDGGSAYAAVIRYDLGEPVLQLVEALSDASAEHKAALADAAQRLDDWHQRKRAYLARLVDEDARVLLVSACDKLHNLRAIRADLAAHGLATFARFTAARADTLWYYAALVDVLCPRLAATHAALATALRAEIDALHAEVARLVDADGGGARCA